MSTFFAFPGHSGFAVGWRRRPFIQQALLLQRTPEIIRDRRGNPLQAVFQLRYRAGAGNNRGHRRVSQDKLQRGRWQTDVIIAADVFNFADFLQNRRAGRALVIFRVLTRPGRQYPSVESPANHHRRITLFAQRQERF